MAIGQNLPLATLPVEEGIRTEAELVIILHHSTEGVTVLGYRMKQKNATLTTVQVI